MPVRGNQRRAAAALQELINTYQGFSNIEPMNTLLSLHRSAGWRLTVPILPLQPMTNIAIYYTSTSSPISTPENHRQQANLRRFRGLLCLQGKQRPKSQLGYQTSRDDSHCLAMGNETPLYPGKRSWFADKPKHVRYHGFEPYSIQEVANLLQLTANEPIAVPIFLA